MSKNGDFEYKFGTKNNWRRWVWNRIIERLSIPPPEALVLYLAGADNADKAVATSHRFREDNLIAVERNSTTVSDLRKSGTLVIESDLFHTLNSWPENKSIHVLHADVCCGLENSFMVSLW